MHSKPEILYLLVSEGKLNIPGIDTVELIIGEAGSLTGWHVEDLNFGSVNYPVSGKPKMWVEVSYKYQNQTQDYWTGFATERTVAGQHSILDPETTTRRLCYYTSDTT
ncbi:hypothetical protein DAPPUDRAFT_248561 [Daphnia pulex]|uniref:JmjC domain-containing protein n=1 Tax=Daphnia pulex TaxID=6669 RepID=E9GUE0_DAPPU|nr:hypothetical protein DAPPUDRAFT_248561 [Daphnia pulex]|eukprot:EFX76816.1 hypothetical protein DAPPUDRAFT_248561 [Daphnia pulex]